ncbi:MAG: sulfurtransferase [Gammaproteobacteria bacterium]|nr:MAG: sulfurtransferase [Gammaproteobacteria bacterium]
MWHYIQPASTIVEFDMEYVHPELLISPEALENALDDPELRVLDTTVFLKPAATGYRAESGLEKYSEGHIPGATFVDLIKKFSDTSSGLGFTLPGTAELADAFGDIGVSKEHRVVVYSSGHMMWATRAWWLLHYCGHTKVAVLNGGLERWRGEERLLTQDVISYPSQSYEATPRRSIFVGMEEVCQAQMQPGTRTVNALSPAVYAGTGDQHYGRRGHIPGSINLHYDDLLEDGNFRGPAQLREILTKYGLLDAPKVITYCGGGISATIDAFACLLIGQHEVAVYDGSMSEWVRDESLPLTTGQAP